MSWKASSKSTQADLRAALIAAFDQENPTPSDMTSRQFGTLTDAAEGMVRSIDELEDGTFEVTVSGHAAGEEVAVGDLLNVQVHRVA